MTFDIKALGLTPEQETAIDAEFERIYKELTARVHKMELRSELLDKLIKEKSLKLRTVK